MTVKQIRNKLLGIYVFMLSWSAFAGQALARVTESHGEDGKAKWVCYGCSEGGPNPDEVKCWVCNIFELFFDTGNYFAATTAEALTSSGLILLGVGLALWLAFHIMPIVASFRAGNVMQMITKIGIGLFKAMVVACFLSIGLQPIFNYIISPTVNLAMGVSDRIMASVNAGEEKKINDEGVQGSYERAEIKRESSPNSMGEEFANTDGVFDEDVRGAMLGIVKNTFATIDYAQSFSSFLLCESTRPFEFEFLGITLYIPTLDFKLFNTGILSWCIFGIMSLVFPFYIIDALFRAILICLLSPLFMVAWVFPATAGYAAKAFNMFLGCVVTFVMTGLVVAVGIRISLIPVNGAAGKDLLSMCGDDNQLPLIPGIIDDRDMGVSPFFIIICGIIAIKYIKKVADIVGVFGFEKVEAAVGNKMLNAGSKVAVAAAATAIKVATKSGGAKGAADRLGKKGAKLGKASGKLGEFAKKNPNSLAGKAAGGASKAVGALGKAATGAGKVADKIADKTSKVKGRMTKAAKAVAKVLAAPFKLAKKAADKAGNKIKTAAGNTKLGKTCNKIKGISEGKEQASNAAQAFAGAFVAARKKDKNKKKTSAKSFAQKMAKKMKKNIKNKINRAIYGDTIMNIVDGVNKGKEIGQKYKDDHSGGDDA